MIRRAIVTWALLAVLPASAGAQAPERPWRIVPQLGVALHGGYYDDPVVTVTAGSSDLEQLDIDPGAAVRVGAVVEYAASPTVSVYGGVAASWPEADVRSTEDPLFQTIDLRVIEVSAGALVRLGQWGGAARVIPFYVGGDLTLAFHSSDDFLFDNSPAEFSTTAFGASGKFGVEYGIGPALSLRGEARYLLLRSGFGDLEDAIARAVGADSADLESGTFAGLQLNAGLAVRF